MSETLVVVSKVKAFIKKNSELSTSASVMNALTKMVETACLKAIENSKNKRPGFSGLFFGGGQGNSLPCVRELSQTSMFCIAKPNETAGLGD